MEPIRVMLVDDERLAIEHIRSLVDWEAHGLTVAAEAVTARKALAYAKIKRPRVVLMDIRMPAMDGLEVSRRLLHDSRRIKIILLTSHRDFEYAKEAFHIGVSDYWLKHEMNETSLCLALLKLKEQVTEEERTVRKAEQAT